MSKIFFILRADSHIGSGHLMRCSRLASLFKHDEITFVTPALSEILGNTISDFSRIEIADWNEAVQSVSELKPDLLVVDCYELDRDFETLCIPACRKLAVIDDLHNRVHNCHILIDGNITSRPEDYKNLVPKTCKLLVGQQYNMTDKRFLNYRKNHIRDCFATGLICFGGADPVHATLKTVKTIAQSEYLKKMHYTVITGAANPDYDKIKFFLDNSEIRHSLLRHSTEIPKLMNEHDFAIGACGVMGNERLCIGIPSVNVLIADNQKSMIELSQKYNIGRLLSHDNLNNKKLLEEAVAYAQQHGDEIRRNGQKLIDGKGNERITVELKNMLK